MTLGNMLYFTFLRPGFLNCFGKGAGWVAGSAVAGRSGVRNKIHQTRMKGYRP